MKMGSYGGRLLFMSMLIIDEPVLFVVDGKVKITENFNNL